ncbi:cytochrome P450 [Xylariomycetidae sp. FL2044]|nr:cytochrome P450 [Xylariomycetidae sp. FL2044]
MEPIPGPPGWPLIGNLLDVNLNDTIQSSMELTNICGRIYKVRLGGTDRIVIGSQELVNEVCSRKGFSKHIMGSIGALSKVMPHGLFMADTAQESWGQVRRTLNPAFTPNAARHGPTAPIDVSADFMRLTIDTIALTALSTRLNPFYHDEYHPFVQRFSSIFTEFEENSAFPRGFYHDVMKGRRDLEKHQAFDKPDVFTAMLHRRDPVTGKQLSDDMIIDNMITFLFAGHDTTAGLLSFLMFPLIRNPDAYTKVQEEVHRVLGARP